MANNKNSVFTILSAALLIAGLNCALLAQIPDKKQSDNKAIAYFQKQDYSKALNAYMQLGESFPQNPIYQYYIGRCLLALNENTMNAIDNLRFAAVKGNIPDSWFYLGQAYHRNSQYGKAVDSYKRFIREGKKSEVKRLGVKKLLQRAEKDLKLSDNKELITASDPGISITGKSKIDDNTKETMISAQPVESENADIYQYSQFKNEEAYEPETDVPELDTETKVFENSNNENLTTALRFQLSADSLNRLAKTKRAELKETVENEKRNILISEITLLEKESKKSQSEADKIYLEMQVKTKQIQPEETNIKAAEAIELKEEIDGIRVYQYKTDAISAKNDSANRTFDGKVPVKLIDRPSDDNFSLQDIPFYSKNSPVPLRRSFPDILVYYIQLGVFSKKVDDTSFGGITPVCYEELVSRGLFKYYAGLFHTLKSAGEALQKIKTMGYPDSFIVAFYKDDQVSVDKARQIEYAQIKF